MFFFNVKYFCKKKNTIKNYNWLDCVLFEGQLGQLCGSGCVIMQHFWEGVRALKQIKITWQHADTNWELLSILLMFSGMFVSCNGHCCASGMQIAAHQSPSALRRDLRAELYTAQPYLLRRATKGGKENN